MTRDRISFSEMNKYCQCGMQHHLHYNEGIKLPPTPPLIGGNKYHKTLELNHRQKIDTDVDLPLKELTDFYESLVRKEFEGEILLLKKNEKEAGKVNCRDNIISRGIEALGLYHREFAPNIHPLAVEQDFKVDVGKDLPYLYGFIDLIDIYMKVVDHKMSSKSPSEDAAEESIQLIVYALGFYSLYGYLPDEMELQYAIVSDKAKSSKPKICKAVPTEEKIRRFMNRLRHIVEGIVKGVIIPPDQSSWLCGACGYKELGYCPF